MIVISAENVGKRYAKQSAHRPWTLQEFVIRGFRGLRTAEYFWSLKHVSFTVKPAGALGVIGSNGAGKSTLLRLLGNVSQPDEGRLTVTGKVSGLLELTAGFHPDLTGRENAFIAGVLRGLTRVEVADQFSSIVDFSELGEYIDQPLRSYSTGMQVRLAFSVAVHCQPDVLLVDEVLAVGDLQFQRKCLDRISSMRQRGCTLVVVSHDAGLVSDFCDEALWLRRGEIEEYGPAAAVVSRYVASCRNETARHTPLDTPVQITSQGVVLRAGRNRFGSLEVVILDVRIHTDTDNAGVEITEGGTLIAEIEYSARSAVEQPIFGITIVHDDGRVCFNAGTDVAGGMPDRTDAGHITAKIEPCNLEPGTYFVDVGIYERDWKYAYDYHSRSHPLIVRHRTGKSRPDLESSPEMRAVWLHHAVNSARHST